MSKSTRLGAGAEPGRYQAASECETDRLIGLARFSYSALDPAKDEIRLIRITHRAAALAANEPLSCSIWATSLSNSLQTPYCAISYAWGDPSKSRPLLIDGKLICITVSLDGALRQFISLGLAGTPFWIDVLCINQEDNVEKSWQVQRMMHIYERADFVLAWLGPASDDSDVAADAIAELSEEVNQLKEPVPAIDNAEADQLTDAVLTMFHDTVYRIAGDLEYPWKAIDKFFARSWWDRVWTIQEFIAAKNVLFLCGTKLFKQEVIFVALQTFAMIDALSMERMMQGSTGISRDSGRNTLELFRARARYQSPNVLILEDLLLMVIESNRKASDHRDILFALISVAQNSEQFQVNVDYEHTTIQTTYQQFMVQLLNRGRLRALWLCHTSSKEQGLPSWVPDWSAVGNEGRQPLAASPCPDYLGPEQTKGKLFSACDWPLSLDCSYNDGKATLKLYGLQIDSVRAVGPGAGDLELVTPSTVEEWMTTVLRMLRSGQQLYDDGLSEEVVWRTSILDMEYVYSDKLCAEYRQRARPEFYTGYLEFVENNKNQPLTDPKNPAMRSRAFRAFLEGTHCRRPFVTEKGYVGQGPPDLQVGDIAAVVLQAEAPFLFRKVLERYQVIGEAYIHEIMDGEFMSKSDTEIVEFDCC